MFEILKKFLQNYYNPGALPSCAAAAAAATAAAVALIRDVDPFIRSLTSVHPSLALFPFL